MSADPAPAKARTHWVVWAFAAIGALGIVGILALMAMLFHYERPYQPAKVAGAKPETVFTLGSVDELRGTNLIRIDILASDGRGGSSAYSGGEADTRNILLLDKASGASRKLLPDNARHIDQSRFLPAKAGLVPAADDPLMSDGGGDVVDPPAYYVLTISEGDRSHDILVGTLASGRQAYVMRNVDGIDSVWMQSPTRIGFIVRERLNLYYRIVDVPTLKVVTSTRVAID